MPWKPLVHVPENRITDARLQLHWAAQLPASVGYSFVEPEDDWSHVSLASYTSKGEHVLVSQPARVSRGFSLGLRLVDLTLLFFNEKQEVKHTFALSGHSLEESYTWLEKVVQSYLPADSSSKITRPDHELPAHPVSSGASFNLEDQEAFRMLSDWFANATNTLQDVADKNKEASPVRCWPHHFDIATLLKFDKNKDAEEARSVGIGFVPGDGGYPEPYIYVTPWPYPESPALPELEGGHWHQEGWFGAVLPSTEIIGAGEAQHQYVSRFTASAMVANKAFLGIA